MIHIPVQVDVDRPYDVTIEITPPTEGVYNIKSLRPIGKDDNFTVMKRGNEVRLDSCSQGFSIIRIESELNRHFWEGVLKLDTLGPEGHALTLSFSQLSPIRIIFKPPTVAPSIFAIVLNAELLQEVAT